MKKKVTLPRVYNPGKGHPPETLAYLSPAEHDLIRRLTDGTAQRGPKGVRSYADDSSSSKGVSRGDSSGTKGSAGVGQGGQSGGSASGSRASGSPSGGVSTGGATRGGNSGVSGSKGGGASTQAPGMGGNAGPIGSRSLSNAASGLAASRQTALGGISQAAQANASGTATQWGGRSMSSPLTAGNGSYYGPKGGNALNTDARMAAARSVGFNAPSVARTPGDAETLGRMMMAESGAIKNRFGGVNTMGLQGVADVVRNRMASSQFPDTVPGVLSQPKQFSPMFDGSFNRTPANATATRIAESVLSGESPSVVGNALNYGNLHTINNMPGYSSSATRSAFNGMTPTATIADARNPNSLAHTFGTIGKSDVSFAGPSAYNPGIGSGIQVASASPFGNLPAAPRAPAGPNIVAAATTPATTTDAPQTGWKDWVKAKTGVDVDNAVAQASAGNKQVADIQNKYGNWGVNLAAAAIKSGLFGGGSGQSNNTFGTAQDRSRMNVPMQAPMQQQFANNYGGNSASASTNPLTVLSNLKANMIAKGASPEQIAYVQSIIDEISQTQVA